MVVEFALLVVGSYLLGSVPTAYLVGKWRYGIDVRRQGSGNVGASNLLRFSRRIAISVMLFDMIKGMAFVAVAWAMGLGVAHQVTIGVAAVIGHNWPIFLRFSGGRGIMTTVGVAFITPFLNGFWPWPVAVFCVINIIVFTITHTSPTGMGAGVAAMPLVSWLSNDPFSFTMGLLAMFLIMAVRRLTVPRDPAFASVGYRQLLFNRLFLDRDIRDKEAWMNRFANGRGIGMHPTSQEASQKKGDCETFVQS